MQISEFNDLLDEYRLCLSILNVCREKEVREDFQSARKQIIQDMIELAEENGCEYYVSLNGIEEVVYFKTDEIDEDLHRLIMYLMANATSFIEILSELSEQGYHIVDDVLVLT